MGNPLSQQIAEIIEKMLEENGGELELQRNQLANTFGCVPSQINYVITSRFNSDRGYIVESRRGGGGYVKITKVRFDSKNTFLMHILAAISTDIDYMSARALVYSLYENEIISARELALTLSLISDSALSILKLPEIRNAVRANMLKSYVLTLKNA